MADKLRISVDHHKCVGSTMCVLILPKVFILNAFGQSSVLDQNGESAAEVVGAAEQCPLSAITVEDNETGKQLFP